MRGALPGLHADALVEAAKTAVGGVSVYLDEVPDDPPLPYVVVWSDAASSSDESLGDVNELGTFHPALTVAAQSPARCRQVRDRLEAIFDDLLPVAGRLCEVERMSASQIARDPDIPNRLVYWCRDILELRSYAA